MNYHTRATPEAVAKIRSLFRREVALEELAGAGGALAGSTVELSARHGWLWLDISHPDVLTQERSFRRAANGGVYVYNHEFTKRHDAPPGLGAKAVARQVAAARDLGCQRIEMVAQRAE